MGLGRSSGTGWAHSWAGPRRAMASSPNHMSHKPQWLSWGVGFLGRDRRSLARGRFLYHSCQFGNESNQVGLAGIWQKGIWFPCSRERETSPPALSVLLRLGRKSLCWWLYGQRTGMSWHSRPARRQGCALQRTACCPSGLGGIAVEGGKRDGVRATAPQTSAGQGRVPYGGPGGMFSVVEGSLRGACEGPGVLMEAQWTVLHCP